MCGIKNGRYLVAVVLGETSNLIGCCLHIHQPAAANLYRKCYTVLLNAAAFWLQPAVMNFDVFPYSRVLNNHYKPFMSSYLCCISTSFRMTIGQGNHWRAADPSEGSKRGNCPPPRLRDKGFIIYPPEVSSMKYCCLGVFRKEYVRQILVQIGKTD